MRAPPISAERRTRLAFWALAGLSLFVAHDAIYLAQIGPGEALAAALRTAGHGYWGWASLGLTAVGAVTAVSMLLRLRHLHRRAALLGAMRRSTGPFAPTFAAAWLRVAALVAVGFVVQENVEHVIAHGHAPGAGALLGPEHPLAIPVIVLIGAIAAALAALVSRTEQALVLAIEAALRRPVRPPQGRPGRPPLAESAIGSVLAHPGAGRAPPSAVVLGI